MMLSLLIILTLLAAAGAGYALRAARRPALRLWQLARTRNQKFSELGPGQVALRGQVVAIDALRSEETGRTGVYLAYTADRWQRTGTIGGLSGQWMRAEEDAEAAPFELSDGNSTVLIDPRGAEVIAAVQERQLAQPDGTTVRYQETMVEEGAEIVVLGQASAAGGLEPSATYRGHTHRLAVGGSPRAPLLLAQRQGLLRLFALQALLRASGVLPLLVLLGLLLLQLRAGR